MQHLQPGSCLCEPPNAPRHSVQIQYLLIVFPQATEDVGGTAHTLQKRAFVGKIAKT